jgi:hypothetical protein
MLDGKKATDKAPAVYREAGMAQLPEEWWIEAQAQLSGLLEMLDRHQEPLVAAHVATALECLRARLEGRNAA